MQLPIGMSRVLPILVCGLVAGASTGSAWPDIPRLFLLTVLAGWAALAIHATRVGSHALVSTALAGACAVGGVWWAGESWRAAWRPPLRLLFEAVAAEDRREAVLLSPRPPPEDASARMVVLGVLRADASPTASGSTSLALDVEWAGRATSASANRDAATNPAAGGVLLTVNGSLTPEFAREWRAGRRIRATADLRRVARYLDPGVVDQERSLARRGVTLVGTVKSAALVEVVSHGAPYQEAAASIRAFSRRAVQESVGEWGSRAAGIVTAIVIGDRSGLDAEVERALQEAGTYHVIAISGGNIAILAGLMLAAFRVLGVLGRTAMLSAAGSLIVYGFLVGGGASVSRAVLMAVFYFVGRAWDLKGPAMHAWVLAVGLLVLHDPLSVSDPAMLLTFGATAAVMATGQLRLPASVPSVLGMGLSMLLASAATEVVLLPVSAQLFSRVTFAGLLLNFAAIPLMAVTQIAGMLAVPVYLVAPAMAHLAGWVAGCGAEGLVRSADFVKWAPWLTWRVAPPGLLLAGLYCAAVLVAWRLWRSRRSTSPLLPMSIPFVTTPGPLGWRNWPQPASQSFGSQGREKWTASGLAAVLGVCILASLPTAWSHADGRLHVTQIDVGQGDAAFVRFPSGRAMLIDAGGLSAAASFDIGDRVVGPVLRRDGVRALDALVVTHGDADHMGGIAAMLRDFPTRVVWDGVPVPPFEPTRRLRELADRQGVPWMQLQRGDRSLIDGVEIAVLHPPLPDWERQDVRNEDSVVIEVRWRNVSFVFTGDIGRESEPDVARLVAPARMRVVKVPHHGSTTSSTDAFVRALAPDVALVSAGRSNNFGHPSPVVLRRYAEIGTKVFRTDQDGAIECVTDGDTLDVRTFTGRTLHLKSSRALSRVMSSTGGINEGAA